MKTNNRKIALSLETRKELAAWLVDIIETQGNLEKFFDESEWGEKPLDDECLDFSFCANHCMRTNMDLTHDGENTQLLKALYAIIPEIEKELPEAAERLGDEYQSFCGKCNDGL